MNPDNIELRSTSQQFKYEKMSYSSNGEGVKDTY